MPWPSCLQRPGHLGRRLRVFGSGSAPSTCPVPHGSALTGAPDRALPVSLQPLLCLSSKYGESMRGVRMLDAGHAGDLPGHYRNWRRYQLMSSTRENTRLNVRRKARQTQAVTLIRHTNTENSESARCIVLCHRSQTSLVLTSLWNTQCGPGGSSLCCEFFADREQVASGSFGNPEPNPRDRMVGTSDM